MRNLRNAALFAVVLVTAVGTGAAEQKGPAPSDVIHPRGATASEVVEAESANMASMVPAPTSSAILTTAGYVIFIVLLIGGAVYLLKRGSLPRPFSKGDGALKVLESRMLGNRQFLLVVEYEEARMLVGVCPGRIDYLTPLAGHPLMDTEAEPPQVSAPAAFAEVETGGRS